MKKNKQSPASVDSTMLTSAQLSKLKALTQPDRWIDETFNRTEIGMFLLNRQLIAPNPNGDSKKAYVITSAGHQALKTAKQQA